MKRALGLSLLVAACAHARAPNASGDPGDSVRIPGPSAPVPSPQTSDSASTPSAPQSGSILEEYILGGDAFVNGGPLAIDKQGNLFVVGTFNGNASFAGLPALTSDGEDIFFLKLDGAKRPTLSKRFGGKGMDLANDVVVGADGGIYVSGA